MIEAEPFIILRVLPGALYCVRTRGVETMSLVLPERYGVTCAWMLLPVKALG